MDWAGFLGVIFTGLFDLALLVGLTWIILKALE